MAAEKLEIGVSIESSQMQSQMPLNVSQEWTTGDVLNIARHFAA
jgi:hypothetical protein